MLLKPKLTRLMGSTKEIFLFYLIIIFSHFMFYKLHAFDFMPFLMASNSADLCSGGEAFVGLEQFREFQIVNKCWLSS